MLINYSVKFDASEYKNSNAIIKINCATCNYLGYSYVHVTKPCKIAVVHKCNYLSEYYNDEIK